MKFSGVARGAKPRPPLKSKKPPSPVAAVAPPSAPDRTAPALQAATGPYSGVLNSLDKEARVQRDIANRRQRDNQAYTAWQQTQQAKIGMAARQSDENAARANLASQVAAGRGAIVTQQFLAGQRAGRQDVATPGGAGNAGSAMAEDARVTQGLMAAAQQQQNSAARSSQQKAGFLAAATAAAGAANSNRIAGETSTTLRAIEGDKRQVLSQREADAAAAASAEADRQAKAAEAAADRELAASKIASSESIAAARIQSAERQGHLGRVAASKRARLGGSAGGVSPSEARQRAGEARDIEDKFAALKSAAAGLKGKKTPYSTAKQTLLTIYPDWAEDSVALNAALSAIYDPKAKGGKPRGKALTDYQRRLDSIRKGR